MPSIDYSHHPALCRILNGMEVDLLGEICPDVHITDRGNGFFSVELSTELPFALKQDNWQVRLYPAIKPYFHWAPHLTPNEMSVIDMHVYRTPALIMQDEKASLCVMPDVLLPAPSYRWYMDLNAEENCLILGASKTKVTEHVLYERVAGAVFPAGRFTFSFTILLQNDRDGLDNPFRRVLAYWWEKMGSRQARQLLPREALLPAYVKRAFAWAFDLWKEQMWQEFWLSGKKVGAPAFIVNVSQCKNYAKPWSQRESLSVWNQAWFSSLRSAAGQYRYAKACNDEDLLEKARMTKELALSFPQKNGLFDAVIAVPNEKVEIDGVKVDRPLSWDNYYFGNSNRNPFTRNLHKAPYHILDMSVTATEMLLWYVELEADERLLSYAVSYADALITWQDEEGFFPAWIDKETGKAHAILRKSPESAASATLLWMLYRLTGQEEYRASAEKVLAAMEREILYTGKWEDFETYWSCGRYGYDTLVGKKVARNNMYKQSTLSMFYTAEAFFTAYQVTGDSAYLRLGQRALDEMLMVQSSLQPPWFPLPVVGGFGVMNADGEHNDARQSLFANLILKYGCVLSLPEYTERGLAALKASFSMMYCPENPVAKAAWEKRWPFLNEKDYGFTMENYGHNGHTEAIEDGIGEFTIWDWGPGSAAAGVMRAAERFPDLLEECKL